MKNPTWPPYVNFRLNHPHNRDLKNLDWWVDQDFMHCINLNKESECFNGIGERGFVVVPQETHKRVRDNLDFYLDKAGLKENSSAKKSPPRGI